MSSHYGGNPIPEGSPRPRQRRRSSASNVQTKQTRRPVLEWIGWKRDPSQKAMVTSQRALVSPQAVKRESITGNIPQIWDREVDGKTALVKKQEGMDPIALILKIISDIFGDFLGFVTGGWVDLFHHKK